MQQASLMSKNGHPARVMIVDDHPLVRIGMASLISACPDLTVDSEADGVTGALLEIERSPPDVALIDISLKDGHGIDLIKKIHQKVPTVRILAVSLFDETLYGERALNAGALGYLNKESARRLVVDAIRKILDGQLFISDNLAQHLATRSKIHHGVRQSVAGIESLTRREMEVLKLIGEGLMTNQIARKLNLSIKTVESHRKNIKHKLQLTTSAELSREATLFATQ
jgi:DNA-binding NarL/FixJ family response regulator